MITILVILLLCSACDDLVDAHYERKNAEIREARHEDLVNEIRKNRQLEVPKKKKKITKRRVIKNPDGTTIAEEITEEEI